MRSSGKSSPRLWGSELAVGAQRSKIAALAAALVLAAVPGCGGGGAADSDTEPPLIERSSPRDREGDGAKVARSHCAPGLADCRTTSGRIAYVERVDPDGDGDAHFVVVDPQGITLPGLTAIDVGKRLRPHPLPGIGDLVSAAGPVQTGSLGQSQIHALELNVGR